MISKVLWTICGLLVLAGVTLILSGQFRGTEKKVSGVNIFNLKFSDDFFSVKTHPKKNKDARDPIVASKASYLIDLETFYPLYAEGKDEKLPIASTTKMATAIVVLENYSDRLSEVVEITPKMIAVEGSDIQLRSGEKMTVENLVNGLLIMSGNDTAYALAGHFGGKDNFVSEMNKKVSEIGAKNTQYQDPAGLDDTGYSTAHDLALIAAYGLKIDKFAEIVRTPNKTIYSADGRISHELKNSNRMLRQEEQYYYPYAIGIKTGFTNDAGHVLVSGAQKDGHKILSVVLNTNENTLVASAKESKKLLEWGFDNWSW